VVKLLWATSVIIPALLTYFSAGHESLQNIIALMAGTVAFTMMAINLVLATRPPWIEGALGGLDKVYSLHRRFGICILALALVHTQVRFQQLQGILPPGSLGELARDIAKPAFYTLVVLAVLSLIKRVPGLRHEIPWALWRWSHRLFGPVFLVLAIHQFLVKSPFESTDAIKQWTSAMSVVGLVAWLSTLVVPFLRRRAYVVESVDRLAGATKVVARPKSRGIGVRPGQFVFLSAARSGLREPHPFSVSHVGPNGRIGFHIQSVGDFTRRLRESLMSGDKIGIEGGYGRFGFRRSAKRQVWLAGGIGITPFLSMAEALVFSGDKYEVVLVHAVRSRDLALENEVLRDLTGRSEHFSYVTHVSAEKGRLDGAALIRAVPFLIRDAELWFCGPTGLRKSLVSDLKAAGQMPRAVHFERFEFR